jgi:hypothetical protein
MRMGESGTKAILYHIFLVVIVLLPFLGLAFSAVARDRIDGEFKGKWFGDSKVIYSVFGDLTVTDDALIFEKIGRRKFKIISKSEDSILLDVGKLVYCGRYVRLGPIRDKSGNQIARLFAGDMEFSVYETKEKAMAPRKVDPHSKRLEYSSYCVWGLYSRY